ncbi:unnamed protein product, partial [Discosporangium mesarthrocarpum]
SSQARADPELGPFLSVLRHSLSHKGWDEDFDCLLIMLLVETFIRGDNSHWYPYLRLLPRPPELNSPLFFTQEEVEMLKGSDVLGAATRYRRAVLGGFEGKYRGLQVFGPGVITLERYLWATAILDSRSIWWGGTRHLVPMLDLVNCGQGPLETRVHSTTTDFRGAAITHAAWAFKKGQQARTLSQVLEDYGQPNHIYFLYHGFSLADNKHD